MSAKSAILSKPQSRLEKAIVQSPRAAKARAVTGTVLPPEPAPPPATIVASAIGLVASAIGLVAFRQLRRAPENVRHIRKDEDIEPLADDITAHGLLQSLIGYRALDTGHKTPVERVWIVAGGRRLQALGVLVDRGTIDIDFEVPVLIRPREEAIELSLSENLQKRDMSPVDECRAFRALMDLGTHSPDELARKFGFTERYVRQRLRLAELAEPILDALAERRMTLPSAMAYAESSDPELQLQVFKQQEKSTWDQHSVHRIKADYSASRLTTNSPLFRFVTAEIYERDGGAYEDDLFAQDALASSGRRLASGPILMAAAKRMVDFQAIRVLGDVRAKHPSIAELVAAPNLRIDSHPWKAPKVPNGYVMVEPDYSSQNSQSEIWKRIDKLGIAAIAIVGINDAGAIGVRERSVFVPKGDVEKVKLAPRSSGSSYVEPTAEEREAERLAKAIDLKQWRLGAGSFAGTPLDGRAFWPNKEYGIWAVDTTNDPRFQDGRLVTVQIYVTNAEHDAMREDAKLRVAEERAAAAERARAAEEAKLAREQLAADLVKMDPPPAVLVFGGEAFFRRADGEWTDDPALLEDKHPGLYSGIVSILDVYSDQAFAHYASIEAYQSTLPAGAVSEGGLA